MQSRTGSSGLSRTEKVPDSQRHAVSVPLMYQQCTCALSRQSTAIVTELAPEGGLLLPRYLHPWAKLHAPSLAFAPPAKVAGGEAAGTCAKLGGDHDQTRSPAPLAFARVKSGHLGACTITGFGKDTVVCKNPSFSEVTTFGNFLPRPSSRRDSRRTIALLPLNSNLSNPACETGRRRCPLLATCTLTLQLVVS